MTSKIHHGTASALAKLGAVYEPEHDRVMVAEGFWYDASEIDLEERRDEQTGEWVVVETPGRTERFYSPPQYVPAVRLPNGRWIAASWDTNSQQWKCWDLTADFKSTNQQARYAFARSLEGLTGCRTYRSLPDLVRAHMRA